jgi:hypothetical protein
MVLATILLANRALVVIQNGPAEVVKYAHLLAIKRVAHRTNVFISLIPNNRCKQPIPIASSLPSNVLCCVIQIKNPLQVAHPQVYSVACFRSITHFHCKVAWFRSAHQQATAKSHTKVPAYAHTINNTFSAGQCSTESITHFLQGSAQQN